MKLTAFRIRNFRSIKDTGWHNLAFDNITCLIGQNESGKTSILEGIKAFHDGILIEDMLRSDLSLPITTCRYKIDLKEIENSLDMHQVHPEIRKRFQELDYISISRIWENDLSSYITTGDEFNDIFSAEEDIQKKREIKVKDLLIKFSDKLKKADIALEKAKKELSVVEEKSQDKFNELGELKKASRSSLFSKGKKIKSPEIEGINSDIEKIEAEKEKKQKAVAEKEEELSSAKLIKKLYSSVTDAENEIQLRKNELAQVREEYVQLSNVNVAGVYQSEKDQRVLDAKEDQLRLETELAGEAVEKSLKDYKLMLLTAEKVLDGIDYEEAHESAIKELEKQNTYLSSKQLGEELFKFSPDFEMFEDFSSLLPNRIDLEDIVLGNTQAEGYKAAINFLTITGLDYSFFQQPSSRILKQKIENMNGELTLNFQDFWRQNVGKNNKIKINFELAHYDHSQAEKSGKPYIEFWIKDETERLYPKQRSRGVRWFLSFFMELKATSIDKSRQNKLLLIDEPGVSLHARAQEDVLMVFDDIKEYMQIIYSTHSPHLIDVNKLYRVIAVQRAVEDNVNSETLVLDARSLKSATADTLSPVYAMMGARLSQQDIIKSFNNVIVKDLATFYFMKAILLLTKYDKKECFFIPASGTSSMPMIINILIGWGLEYVALNFGNEEEKYMYNKLRKELFENNVDLAHTQLFFLRDYLDAEDLFSTIDFKKHIVHVREGITINNSEYLRDNNHSRAVLASNFLQLVVRQELKLEDFDDESKDNLKMVMSKIDKLLK